MTNNRFAFKKTRKLGYVSTFQSFDIMKIVIGLVLMPSPVNLFALALCVIQQMPTKKRKYGLSSALAVEKTLTSAKSSSHALYGVWTFVVHGKTPSLLISLLI